MNEWDDFSMKLSKKVLTMCIQQITLWRLAPFKVAAVAYTDYRKQKNSYNSVTFTDIELNIGVVVAESHSEHVV